MINEINLKKIKWLWQAIKLQREQLLERDVADLFHPPVTEDEISKVEESCDIKFPEDLRLSYLVHRGAFGASKDVDFNTWGALQNTILGCIEELNASPPIDHSAEISSVDFGKNLIPFAISTKGSLSVDISPGPDGVYGQVVEVNFRRGTAKVLYTSFYDFLEKGIFGLNSKEIKKKNSGE